MALNKKPESYYQMARPDIANIVPLNSSCILEIGCGYGGLGKLLKQRGNAEIHGVEINPKASLYLEGVYSTFLIGDIETIKLPFQPDTFDCLILADVLEHLIDPWTVLSKLTNLLKNNGYVVASIPNVRNLALLYKLLIKGRWQLRDAGILDRTHLRFFTRREIEELFAQSGLEIEIIHTSKDGYSLFREIFLYLPLLVVPDLRVSQFLIRAVKNQSLIANKEWGGRDKFQNGYPIL